MLFPRVIVESGGKDDGLEGGHYLRQRKKPGMQKKHPHTASSSRTGCDLKSSRLL